MIFLHAVSCSDSSYQKRLELVNRLKNLNDRQSNGFSFSSNNKYKTDDDWINIENACLANYESLAKANAEFFSCVLTNSRPFRICGSCNRTYHQVIQTRDIIEKDSHIYAESLFQDGLTCKDIIEATDRVQLAVKIADSIDDIWSDSKCAGIEFIRVICFLSSCT